MSRILIFLFALFALVCAQSTDNTSSSPRTVISSNTTTEKANTTTTTTPVPTTSTTPKITTPTTTAKPNTTTVAPTTPVPPTPPPVPAPAKFSGNVTENNKTCINVGFSVKITIKYNNTKNEEKTTGFTLSSNATVDPKSSHCGEAKNATPEAITINFANEEFAKLTLTFNTSDKSVYVNEVELSFVPNKALMPQLDDKLYGKPITAAKNELSLFKVAADHSYVCTAVQSAKLDSHEDRITGVQIDFTESKVEAYINESNKGKFDSEIDCKSADISDVVPIAVGAALAGLVIIVLIAYFIGRRRSRRLAYQSV